MSSQLNRQQMKDFGHTPEEIEEEMERRKRNDPSASEFKIQMDRIEAKLDQVLNRLSN